MKSLYEKIDKVVISEMEKDRNNFPDLIANMEKNLKNKYSVGDVSITDAVYLFAYKYGTGAGFRILGFYKLFN